MARKVSIKSAADIEMARKAGALAAEVLQVVAEHVRPGVTTDELDRICHDHTSSGAAGHPRQHRLPRLSQDHLRLAQPRHLPRHPVVQGGRTATS